MKIEVEVNPRWMTLCDRRESSKTDEHWAVHLDFNTLTGYADLSQHWFTIWSGESRVKSSLNNCYLAAMILLPHKIIGCRRCGLRLVTVATDCHPRAALSCRCRPRAASSCHWLLCCIEVPWAALSDYVLVINGAAINVLSEGVCD